MRKGLLAMMLVIPLLSAACSAGEITETKATAVETTAPTGTAGATLPSASAPTTPGSSAPATAPPTTTTPPPAPEPFDGLPLADERGTFFSGSGTCTVCHQDMTAGDRDVSIDTAWRSTMMANAALDPYWLATVRSETNATPTLAGVIEDKCATCHMPMARTTASFEGAAVAVLGTGFAHPEHPLQSLAADGVSCTVCHQIEPDRFGDPLSFSGGFAIDPDTPQGDRSIFGPYDPPPGQAATMASISGFTPRQSDHIHESALCATCHTLFTPTVDAAGTVVGEFAEQTPYLEWLASAFATESSCQRCHLPEVAEPVRLSTTGSPLRSPFSQHHFVGGNSFMISVFRALGDQLGVTASSDHFDATLRRIDEQLTTRTALVTVDTAAVTGERLTFGVTVTNLAGHKFPTGYPSRRAWLHVTVLDGSGAAIFESGRAGPDGTIVGNDNDGDPGTYEPHMQRITEPNQVPIYEVIIADAEGAVTTTLLRGAGYLKDNRLLPRGFNADAASPAVLTAGAATEDPDFIGGADTVGYDIRVAATGPFTIEVELLYQAIGYRWAAGLLAGTGPEIDRFGAILGTVPNAPVRIAGAIAAVDD